MVDFNDTKFQKQPTDITTIQNKANLRPRKPSVTHRDTSRMQKEKFLLFTRFLLKYLERKDAKLHCHVKELMKECIVKHIEKVPGYESVTLALQYRLREVVNECYWKRTEAFFNHYLKEKAKAGSGMAQFLMVRTVS